ncbi:DUF6483 family protein [Paenibacillus ginsengarvi]|uniref:Tetratricopeptide repeat protein n=1 Tax=Paenibacillus ginsengarvi TaxID=400777 RepID=A0A3B0CLK5_9BACL|nr:DUF6483 family protein [Paenibacillus ginsengarvi]RKN85850.1 hypothetical protein D7M11_05820 [Paenibacillus ginsengarvi]
MFRNDYIVRMIEQFSITLGTLLGLKRELKPQEALELIGETYKRLFGLNPGLIRALSERDLADLLSRSGEATDEKLLVIAGLMKEEAELSLILDRTGDSYRLNVKALNLTLMAAREQSAIPWMDVSGQIGELLDLLAGYELPPSSKQLLWPYFESEGRLADAEDVLFELLDECADGEAADGNDAKACGEWVEQALQFYERLLELPEDVLEAGNLPLGEVRDGLAEVRKMAADRGAEAQPPS